jgi:hypothetical protein
MGEIANKRDLGYYSIEIIKDAQGSPLVIVKFKSENRQYWAKDHSWCPTLAELEFLYKTTKQMEKSTSRKTPSKTMPVDTTEAP